MKTPAIRLLAALLVLLLVAACGSTGGQRSPRDVTLYSYVSAVRWGEFPAALTFVDPAVLEASPITDLEMERYKQFQVAGYEVKSVNEASETLYEQVVEIRLVNRNTQVERIVTDRQAWRWDSEAKRWWLMTGLPPLDPR